MEALGCIRVSKYYDYINAQCTFVDYNIDVSEALNNYLFYENYISEENEKTLNIITQTKYKLKK